MKKQDGNEKRQVVYNLEIEDNHEFFANNILVHNCAGLIFVMNPFDPFEVKNEVKII
jgi:hypothetical protein